MSNTIVGHYPEYVQLAGRLDCANWFSVPKSQWDAMNRSSQWAENVRFLQTAIADDTCLVFSHHPTLARRGSFYYNELRFLHSKGIRLDPLLDAYVS